MCSCIWDCNIHDQRAKQFDYMYQHAENLTYCNYLEHLIIHVKINILRKQQLGHYINDGVVNFLIIYSGAACCTLIHL